MFILILNPLIIFRMKIDEYNQCCENSSLIWLNSFFDSKKYNKIEIYLCPGCQNIYDIEQTILSDRMIPISQYNLNNNNFELLNGMNRIERHFVNPSCNNDCKELEMIARTLTSEGSQGYNLYLCKDCGTQYTLLRNPTILADPLGVRKYAEKLFVQVKEADRLVEAFSNMRGYIDSQILINLYQNQRQIE